MSAAIAAMAIVAAGFMPFGSPNAEASQPETPAPAQDDALTERGVPNSQRAELLGGDWKTNDDVVHTVVADAEKIDVLTAEARDGYKWSTTASLVLPQTDTDRWISNSCVTTSGDHLALVFAPRAVTNSDVGMSAGAAAAILDIQTGEWTLIDGGYTMAYFNPGCGDDDTVTLTSFDATSSSTSVTVIDAATKDEVRSAKLKGQATSAIADAEGTIFAAADKGVVALDRSGKQSLLARTTGTAFDLVLDDGGRLGYLVAEGDRAVAYLGSPSAKSAAKPVARGPLAGSGLQRAPQGGVVLTGPDIALVGAPRDVAKLENATPHAVISSTGAIVLNEVKPAGLARTGAQADELVDKIEVSATATASDEDLLFSLAPDAKELAAETTERYEALVDPEAPSGSTARSLTTSSAGDPNELPESERTCAVPRNDPNNQAYQPKPRQVEWAVNRAVLGQLTETRPANWRNLGMPSYSAQGLFPRVTLAGGGTIPPQISLAVLMQESNLWQASRFTSPGNTGNPLIGDYYGNRGTPWEVHFTYADCGYGVGQITDGMRLAGRERAGEVALPYNQQRAIALDYTANIAMSVRMLGQKWNQLAAKGITINNGSANYIENWFGAVWAYNTGVQPSVNFGNPGCDPGPNCTGASGTWGLGWSNNPVNPIYAAARQPFLEVSAADAATPQYWPYPEKIMGFAAWGLELPQTVWADPDTRTYPADYAHSYRVANWLSTDNFNGELNRSQVKPPRELFCETSRNLCDPTTTAACTLSSKECWWNGNATWKPDCSNYCGYGFQRFPSSYTTEASSMASTLPALTLRSSFLPNCAAVPSNWLVVDDTKHSSARNPADCTTRPSTGSFEFTFPFAEANGSYPAKIDVHQQGGGFNGHFYFARMHKENADINAGDRLKVTGEWSLGQSLNQWTRVWVHMPSYAAWTPQAGYTVTYGPNESQTRYLPQRRYANEWVPLGVFDVNGVPTVSMTNLVTDVNPEDPRGAGIDDVAWDAVAFEPLSSKPEHFVVALGDSYSSGEGAGAYEPWSDNNGNDAEKRNRCHQSDNAWVRKSTIPGETQSIGALSDASSSKMDFHFLACSGAESEHLLPYHSVAGAKPSNGWGENGRFGQNGMVSQMDAGYLDENTTLVTLSIGGNDMHFAGVISECAGSTVMPAGHDNCSHKILSGDTDSIVVASEERLQSELPDSIDTVLNEVRLRAPNASIVLMGYPKLFETGSTCITVAAVNKGWLNELSDGIQDVMDSATDAVDSPSARAVSVSPQAAFAGKNLCVANGSGITGLEFGLTRGEPAVFFAGDFRIVSTQGVVSQTSVHPNNLGTDYFSSALEEALVDLYP
ncbi:hypothetical protein GCM10027071_00060 [Microbacterium marinum]